MRPATGSSHTPGQTANKINILYIIFENYSPAYTNTHTNLSVFIWETKKRLHEKRPRKFIFCGLLFLCLKKTKTKGKREIALNFKEAYVMILNKYVSKILWRLTSFETKY